MLEKRNLNSAYWTLTLQVADPFKRTLIMDAPFNFNKNILYVFIRRRDTEHDDILHNDTQQNDT
jgi:hypothetical protein